MTSDAAGSTTQRTAPDQKLSVVEKAGYAAGDVASNLYFQTFLYFILIYYTDVVGLSAGAVATMFAVRVLVAPPNGAASAGCTR